MSEFPLYGKSSEVDELYKERKQIINSEGGGGALEEKLPNPRSSGVFRKSGAPPPPRVEIK
ncbi:MAG TPA: hypothetical protein DD473_22255 [Planctomycetaceae bacterium]|nr:hypothetical protein [Planctomycetaceae bacterium]